MSRILHVDGNHWVTVTNIDFYSAKGYADRVLIFDFQATKKVGLDLKKTRVLICKADESYIST